MIQAKKIKLNSAFIFYLGFLLQFSGTPAYAGSDANPLFTQPLVQLVAGARHACLLSNGGVKCWGDNSCGQLGRDIPPDDSVNAPTAGWMTPATVSGLGANVVSITAGERHTCALVNDLTLGASVVKCWGANDFFQLGKETPAVSRMLASCMARKSSNIMGTQLAFVSPVPSAVMQDNLPLKGVDAIAAGYNHTCALLNGSMSCWGSNLTGELGRNLTASLLLKDANPRLVVDPTVPRVLGAYQPLLEVLKISANKAKTCALVGVAENAQSLKCWGDNSLGAIGLGKVAVSPLSPFVLAPAIVRMIRSEAAGTTNIFDPATGLQTSTPALLAGISDVIAGEEATCAIKDGKLLCWGANTGVENLDGVDYGGTLQRAGINPNPAEHPNFRHIAPNNYYPDLVGLNLPAIAGYREASVNMDTGVEGAALGASHACALKQGLLYCWGSNSVGELGIAETPSNNQFNPTLVKFSDGRNAQAVVVGKDFSCALVDAVPYCWGGVNRGFAQLDMSRENDRMLLVSVANSPLPVAVAGFELNSSSAIQDIALGYKHSCKLVGGGVQCWGDNSRGQLGVDPILTPNSLLPVPVADASSFAGPIKLDRGVEAISSGYQHTCALKAGHVYCWGDNTKNQISQLASGPSSAPVLPVEVTSIVSAHALAVHENFNCVLEDGAVRCWGSLQGQPTNGAFTAGPIEPSQTVAVVVNGKTINRARSYFHKGVLAVAIAHNAIAGIVGGHVWTYGGFNLHLNPSNGAKNRVLEIGETFRKAVPMVQGVRAIFAANNAFSAIGYRAKAAPSVKSFDGVLLGIPFAPVPLVAPTENFHNLAYGDSFNFALEAGQVFVRGLNYVTGLSTWKELSMPAVGTYVADAQLTMLNAARSVQRIEGGRYYEHTTRLDQVCQWQSNYAIQVPTQVCLGPSGDPNQISPKFRGVVTDYISYSDDPLLKLSACVIAQGKIQCFGSNEFGQLGPFGDEGGVSAAVPSLGPPAVIPFIQAKGVDLMWRPLSRVQVIFSLFSSLSEAASASSSSYAYTSTFAYSTVASTAASSVYAYSYTSSVVDPSISDPRGPVGDPSDPSNAGANFDGTSPVTSLYGPDKYTVYDPASGPAATSSASSPNFSSPASSAASSTASSWSSASQSSSY